MQAHFVVVLMLDDSWSGFGVSPLPCDDMGAAVTDWVSSLAESAL